MSQLLAVLGNLKENNRLATMGVQGGVPEALWQTYSSFANTMGGTIILGVDEDANGNLHVAGVPDAHQYVKTIWNTLNNRQKISRNILVDQSVRIEETAGKEVIVIDVPRALRTDKPVYINDDVYAGSYRRNGDGDYHCSQEEVRLMIRDSSASPADLVVLDSLGLDALCNDTIQKYRRILSTVKPDLSWNRLSDEALLYRLNAVGRSDKDSELHPTAAGLLMFGYHYEIVKEFPYYLLDYRKVVGEETRWIDRVVSDSATWSGNLFDFYFLVANILTLGIKTPFALDEHMVRIDDTPVHKAVREALINTLIHANYYERRGLVIIKKLLSFEFSNPGGLRIAPEVAIDGGLCDPRNSTVSTMFTLINTKKRADCGLSNIFSVWKQQNWDTPILSETFNPERTILTLVMSKSADIPSKSADIPSKSADIPSKSADIPSKSGDIPSKSGDIPSKSGDIPSKSGDIAGKSGDIREPIRKYQAATEEQRTRILEYLHINERCSNADVCKLLHVKETRAKMLLSQMVEDGLLIAEGEKKGRVYRIRGN